MKRLADTKNPSMARTEPLFNSNNLARLVEFYQELGFEMVNSWEPDGELQWCLVEFEGAPLMLQQSDDLAVVRRDIEIYIVCDDVLPIRERWIRKGLAVSKAHDAFYGMRQIFIKDPDGRTICFESVIKEQ